MTSGIVRLTASASSAGEGRGIGKVLSAGFADETRRAGSSPALRLLLRSRRSRGSSLLDAALGLLATTLAARSLVRHGRCPSYPLGEEERSISIEPDNTRMRSPTRTEPDRRIVAF